MDENARTIQEKILKGIPRCKIQYQRSGGFHKYRIEGEALTHWLYVSEEFVDDSEPVILINLVNVYKIVDTLNNSEESKWLFLSHDGIREVDENFTK